MLFEIQGQKLFGATATLWVLFVFTIFLDPISAAPQQPFGDGLSRRTGNAPGLGVELELGSIVIVGKNKLTTEQRDKIKGSEMILIGFAGAAKTKADASVAHCFTSVIVRLPDPIFEYLHSHQPLIPRATLASIAISSWKSSNARQLDLDDSSPASLLFPDFANRNQPEIP